MQLPLSFVALSLISLCAAVPNPAAPAPAPGPTDASLPTVPEHIVAEYLASRNSTSSLTKRNVHCETSGGSPFTGDAYSAINSLPGGSTCEQFNGGGSFCTTMGCSGSACVAICGPLWGNTNCQVAKNGLSDTANNYIGARQPSPQLVGTEELLGHLRDISFGYTRIRHSDARSGLRPSRDYVRTSVAHECGFWNYIFWTWVPTGWIVWAALFNDYLLTLGATWVRPI
ncbi:hypothetical protein C8J57DRAFT_1240913 [Mycena rebaudengoi]|nr:hypothetical protein C8J57DRAFT_1240913 [Mycena rebaudengoi]